MKAPIQITLSALICILFALAGFAQSGTITTYAGPGLPAEGGSAASQALDGPSSVVLDGSGGFYMAISGQNNVYHVAANGMITRVAGNNTPGHSGDGGPATSAQLFHPTGLALDSSGNLFIADSDNDRIRKVTADGFISTVAGNGVRGFSGDNNLATDALLCRPTGLALNAAGALYIADSCNNRIRKLSNGVIKTVAGTGGIGYSEDDENQTDSENDAINATLNQPMGVAVDAAGIIYIADTGNHRIRIIENNGDIDTIAGNGQGFHGDGGSALSAKFSYPAAIALDSSGNIYIADAYNYRIRKMTSGGAISTVAGNGIFGFSGDDGKAASAQISIPTGIAVDATGNILIADYVNRRIRKIAVDGNITTAAGFGTQGYRGDGGPANSALFDLPAGVAMDKAGNLFIADSSNARVRKVTTEGIVSTVAGNGDKGFGGDGGPAGSARLYSPVGVAVDGLGNLYISDSLNQRVRRVASDGVISTFAGTGTPGFSGDGNAAASAKLNHPWGIAVDSAGSLFIADMLNHRIRKVSSEGIIHTIAGLGAAGFSGDGGPATSAQLNLPAALAVDSAGNLFIADSGNNRIRKIAPDGIISTVAGNGNPEYSGDGGPAVYAAVYSPAGIAVDAAGNVFIADHQNSRVRKVALDGTISTVAGSGTAGFSGDGGPAISAQINYPMGLAADDSGNIFIADYDNNRIRKISFNIAAHYFPQVVTGSGYSTLFTITNTGTAVAKGVLRLTDPQGEPLTVRGIITDAAGITQTVQEGSVFNISVPTRGRMFLSVSGVDSESPLNVGWGELKTMDTSLAGTAAFEYRMDSKKQIAAGTLQSPMMRSANMAVDNNGNQGRWVAYAIANPGEQPINIDLALKGQNGAAIAQTVSFTIGPKQQVARYLSQDLGPAEFKGIVTIQTGAEAAFAAVALIDDQGLLTALPLQPGEVQEPAK